MKIVEKRVYCEDCSSEMDRDGGGNGSCHDCGADIDWSDSCTIEFFNNTRHDMFNHFVSWRMFRGNDKFDPEVVEDVADRFTEPHHTLPESSHIAHFVIAYQCSALNVSEEVQRDAESIYKEGSKYGEIRSRNPIGVAYACTFVACQVGGSFRFLSEILDAPVGHQGENKVRNHVRVLKSKIDRGYHLPNRRTI